MVNRVGAVSATLMQAISYATQCKTQRMQCKVIAVVMATVSLIANTDVDADALSPCVFTRPWAPPCRTCLLRSRRPVRTGFGRRAQWTDGPRQAAGDKWARPRIGMEPARVGGARPEIGATARGTTHSLAMSSLILTQSQLPLSPRQIRKQQFR